MKLNNCVKEPMVVKNGSNIESGCLIKTPEIKQRRDQIRVMTRIEIERFYVQTSTGFG